MSRCAALRYIDLLTIHVYTCIVSRKKLLYRNDGYVLSLVPMPYSQLFNVTHFSREMLKILGEPGDETDGYS